MAIIRKKMVNDELNTVKSQISSITQTAIGFPKYKSYTKISSGWSATANGWIQFEGYRYGDGWVAINGLKVCHFSANFSEEYDGAAGIAPVSIGDVVTFAGNITVRYVPMK